MKRNKSIYSLIGALLISLFLCMFLWASIRAGFLVPAFTYSTAILFISYGVFYFILYKKERSFLYNYGVPIVPWIILLILALVLNFSGTFNYYILIPYLLTISLSYLVVFCFKNRRTFLSFMVLGVSMAVICTYMFYILPKTFYELSETDTKEYQFSALQGDDIQFKDSKGALVDLKNINAKIIFLEFGYSTCPPCVKKAPTTNKLRNSFKGNKDVVFIHVVTGYGDSFDEFQESAKQQEKDFDLFLYAEKKTMKKITEILGIAGFPFEKIFANNEDIFTHSGFSDTESNYYFKTRFDTFNKLLKNE